MTPPTSALDAWEAQFGASFYCLWRKGARFVILNSALMTNEAFDDDPRRATTTFLEEELEVGKVGQHANFMVMHARPSAANGVRCRARMGAEVRAEKSRCGSMW